MSFPSTAVLTDFTVEPNGGPPPTADYGSAILGGGEMVVDSGLCTPEFASGDTPYTAQTYNPPYEVWAILGPVDANDYAIVYANGASTRYAFAWLTTAGDDYYWLYDESWNPVWSSVNEFPALVEGGGLGIRASGGSVELWTTADGVTWTNIHTETGLTLPNPVNIGFGAFIPT